MYFTPQLMVNITLTD